MRSRARARTMDHPCRVRGLPDATVLIGVIRHSSVTSVFLSTRHAPCAIGRARAHPVHVLRLTQTP